MSPTARPYACLAPGMSVHLARGRLPMSWNRAAGSSRVRAAEWFAGGQRIPYDLESARVVTESAERCRK
jgi:hypothetical protein